MAQGERKEEAMTKIHRVLKGPFYDDDEEAYFNLCLVELNNGSLENLEVYYRTMDDAYAVIKQLSQTIEPIQLDLDFEGH